MSEKTIRLLIVEDRVADEELILDAFRDSGYSVQSKRVQDLEAFRAALSKETWDLITSDHLMPSFNSREAL